jgi:hypothetical protein
MQMFNKNDPLIESVTKIMQENQIRRDVEKAVNEELGIYMKRHLPFEMHAAYDALIEEVVQEALSEKLVGNQHKIDVNKNNRLDKQDFKMLRAKKEKKPEEHGVEAEREMASKGEKMYEANKENKEKKNAAVEKIGMERIKKTGAFHGQSPKRTGRAALTKEEKLDEVSPPSAKAERMVKYIKKGYSKDGDLSKKEKSIAYATAWKAYNKSKAKD